MHFLSSKHPINMKTITIIILSFLCIHANAQEYSKKDSLKKRIEKQLFSELSKDSSITFYTVSYTTAAENIPVAYPGGINVFREILFTEISKKIDYQNLNKYDWDKPITFVVNINGYLRFQKDNNLGDLIDTTKFRKFQPGLVNGRLVPIYFEVQLPQPEKLLDWKELNLCHRNYQIITYSSNGEPIYMSPTLPKTKDNLIIISYLWTNQLNEPQIIQGDKNDLDLIKQQLGKLSSKELLIADYINNKRIFIIMKKQANL
ncbi:hypothetical protein GCM10011516_11870 [Sphingobacterium cellulitidis]|uniref:Uncharacterized protein n=2 Tax=Sphingobacterium cellulitidis TaxID=1768011 RepID=A0A8H9KT12_9SPHI|nr:hypothetical protein GCM10011516_11870 [Sphingobacterium soli]